MKMAKRAMQLKPSLTLAITSKAKEMKKNGLDVIGFGAGEPDFDTPETIKCAAIKAIESGFTKYTPASGTLELKKAVCEKFKKDNNINYEPDEVAISCGAKHSLYNIFNILCDVGDEVIIIAPYWLSYTEMVSLAGAKPRIVKAEEKNDFIVDPGIIEKNITRRTKAIVINSPSNPTGAVYDKNVLKEIAKLAISKDLLIISDEIYEKLIYDGVESVSIASFGKKFKDRTITVNGVSKTYSMTGWRIGYSAGPKDFIKKISALQSHSTSNPTSISQVAAIEALSGPQSEVEKMVCEFAKRRDYMVERIAEMKGISCSKPKGAFYLFCNISQTGLDSTTFVKRLLEEALVACVPGIAFGSDKHVRLSFATSMKNITMGLDRMEKWLSKI
ncbi:MAG: pyridoxal phosphate-dependent aminotransferase [Candidatus Omnitrophota bacterium]